MAAATRWQSDAEITHMFKNQNQDRFGSPFFSKVVVCGHCLVTLSLTINETLKWLSSLPILMQVILVVTV